MDFNPSKLQEALNADLPTALDSQGFLTSEMTPRQAARTMLKANLLKKFSTTTGMKDLDAITYETFFKCNDACAEFKIPTQRSFELEIILLAKEKLASYFHSDDLQQCCLTHAKCVDAGMTGPGSSVGTHETSFFFKMFHGPMSVSSEDLYRAYCSYLNPMWRAAEILRFKTFGISIESASKLSTVAKSCKTNRTICTEPSLNMFLQKGAGAIIEGLLRKYHNIDLSLQPEVNRRFARIGSISGRFATIDLSNASDTIATSFVRFMLPPAAFSVLDVLRSKSTSLKGVRHELHLFSSMGNGFTFPLQTLLFATLVRSTYEVMGIIPSTHGSTLNYTVFGDDIICTKTAFDCLCRVLALCGFHVNGDKSFNSGAFRESCGCDFFDGTDIRSVYIKKATNEAHIYTAFNRLLRWCCMHGVYLNHCLRYLKGLALFRPVPPMAADSEGFKTPCARSNTSVGADGLKKYKALRARPKRRVLGPAILDWNPGAVMISALGGFLSTTRGSASQQIVLLERTNEPSYKVVKCKTPNWDYAGDSGLAVRELSYIWSAMD